MNCMWEHKLNLLGMHTYMYMDTNNTDILYVYGYTVAIERINKGQGS